MYKSDSKIFKLTQKKEQKKVTALREKKLG